MSRSNMPQAFPNLIAVIPLPDGLPAELWLSTVNWAEEARKWKTLARKHEGTAKRPNRRRRHTAENAA